MIVRLFQLWRTAASYVVRNERIVVMLVLLFVFPLLFIYTGQQFLEAGRANQERLQKERISTLHDSFEILLTALPAKRNAWQQQIDTVTQKDSDLVTVMVQERQEDVLRTQASSDPTVRGATSSVTDWHTGAAVRPGTTMIYKVGNAEADDWYSYRFVSGTNGEEYFIATVHSMAGVEALFAQRERAAYWPLLLVYVLVGGLAVWQYFLTNYRQLYEIEKEKNHAQDRFLHTVVHELRSPLTAIKGFASMQKEARELPEVQTYATKISATTERMLLLVNDILEVARIQSGKLTLETKPITLKTVVEGIVSELGGVAAEHGLALTDAVTKDITVAVDAKRLQQILVNLVNNAVKYTEEGSITISAITKGKKVEIRIADTGSGISAGDQEKLFTPFFRTQSASEGSAVGTGLGMWITRQLIAKMHGTIGVESIKGVGTHVVMTFPKTSAPT